MDELLRINSKVFGQYYTKKIKDYFDEGQLVTVYAHHSLRIFTTDKNGNIFKIQHPDFGTIFFTKCEWRNKKINKILK
jgi:hypothetical protein